jgi:hypothetical protein
LKSFIPIKLSRFRGTHFKVQRKNLWVIINVDAKIPYSKKKKMQNKKDELTTGSSARR